MMKLLKDEVILAPMSGVTNEPFRLSLKELGVKVTFTEMVSADGLSRKINKTMDMIKIIKEPPVIIPQLFGNNSEILLKATEILVYNGFKIVDLNLGCPAKKIVKKGCGVALMKEPEKVKKIIIKLKKEFPYIHFTVKMRLGYDETSENYLEIADILYNEGISAITLHPRYGKQYYSGKANWEKIKILKEKFKNLFVIGNGDVKTPEDIDKIFNFTNCDAVMIGRGFLENPFLKIQWDEFKEKREYKKFTLKDKISYFKKLFDYFRNYYGEDKALKISIKHIIHLTKGEKGSAKFRAKISKIKKCVEFFNEIMYWVENGY